MDTSHSCPQTLFILGWRNRTLIARLLAREVQGRYRGTVLGLGWALGAPLATLAAYLFVFMHVFEARWDGGAGTKAEYALVMFSGLIAFNLFAECVNRAPGLMLENPAYIKRVLFPLEIMPWVCMGSALFNACANALVLLICYAAFIGRPPATALLLPVVFLPFALFTLGLVWLLAALGVYLRDLRQFLAVGTTLLMFFSPVFYPVSAVRGGVRFLLWCNPLTYVLEDLRSVLFWGKPPDWPPFLAFACVSLLTAWLGFVLFMKIKPGFADVV